MFNNEVLTNAIGTLVSALFVYLGAKLNEYTIKKKRDKKDFKAAVTKINFIYEELGIKALSEIKNLDDVHTELRNIERFLDEKYNE